MKIRNGHDDLSKLDSLQICDFETGRNQNNRLPLQPFTPAILDSTKKHVDIG